MKNKRQVNLLNHIKAVWNIWLYQNIRLFACVVLLSAALFHLNQNEAQGGDFRLIMFTSEDCPACQAWEREIGSVYKKSEYQVEFPITRVDFSAGAPSWLVINESLRGTPTFVIMKNGQEIGRITGFTDPEMFWWQLSSFKE